MKLKSKLFIHEFLKSGLFNYLVQTSGYKNNDPNPTKGALLFGDTDPKEKYSAQVFFNYLHDVLAGWRDKFGIDKSGTTTKFKSDYEAIVGPQGTSAHMKCRP